MKKINKLIFGGTLLSLFAGSYALNLKDVYDVSKKNNANYKSQVLGYQATEEGSKIAAAALFPQISLTGTYSYNWSKTQGVPQENLYGYPTLSATLTQNLFNFAAISQYLSAKKQKEVAQLNIKSADQTLLVNILQAYFKVLTAQDQLLISEAQLKSIKQQLDETKTAFDKKIKTIIDLRKAQNAYQSQLSTVITQRSTLNVNKITFNQLTGLDYESLTPINLGFKVDPQTFLSLLNDNSLKTQIDKAYKDNLAVLIAKMQVEVAKANKEAAIGGHLPTLSASITGTNSGDNNIRNGDSSNVPGNSASASLTATLPIYSGGSVLATVEQSDYSLKAAEQTLLSAKQQLVQNINSQAYGLYSQAKLIDANDQALKAATQNLDTVKEGYKLGVSSTGSLLSAKSTYYDALAALHAAKYNFILQQAQYMITTGQSTDKVLSMVDSYL